MTSEQAKFIELEKQKTEIKEYFEELRKATEILVEQHGVGFHFQDVEGTVYKLVIPDGRFVKFEKYGYQRTRRDDEKKGDLSLTAAREAGFKVEGK